MSTVVTDCNNMFVCCEKQICCWLRSSLSVVEHCVSLHSTKQGTSFASQADYMLVSFLWVLWELWPGHSVTGETWGELASAGKIQVVRSQCWCSCCVLSPSCGEPRYYICCAFVECITVSWFGGKYHYVTIGLQSFVEVNICIERQWKMFVMKIHKYIINLASPLSISVWRTVFIAMCHVWGLTFGLYGRLPQTRLGGIMKPWGSTVSCN